MATVINVDEAAAVDLGALLDARDGAVVTLAAGDTRLVAHRAVLSARSPVFAAMFNHDMLEAASGHVDIPDVEGPVLRQLLAYCYTLQVPQLPSMAPQLLSAADKYGLSVLKTECERQVATKLGVETAAATAVLALRHSCTGLRKTSVDFIKAHTHQVMATQGWADMMRSHTEDLIQVSRLLSEAPPETRNLSAEEKGRRLIQAAQHGAVEKLQSLLAAGADIEVKDEDMFEWTALHWGAYRGHLEAVKCLIERGAQVDARNSKQSTPLHLAAANGHVAVVRMLVASSAYHSARNQYGRTPLHSAADNGHAEAAAALLEAGADKGARNNGGQTPLDLARQNNHHHLIDMLR